MLSKIRGSWVRATREIDLYIYILNYIGLKKLFTEASNYHGKNTEKYRKIGKI